MIRNLLLDIGDVLILMDRKSMLREFAAFCDNIPAGAVDPAIVLPEPERIAFERGEIEPERFYEVFVEFTGCRLSYRHFRLIWASHFRPNTPMIRLGRQLAGRMGTYLLSNTDPIHVPSLLHRFPETLFVHGMALSWELGAMKPEREFYSRALDKFGLDPEECLFVDDNADNVAGAEEFSIRTIHYRNFEETRELISRAFADSGVELESGALIGGGPER